MAIYGVLGDIHGNREALDAVLARLDAEGIACLVCVGDVVGYNADPDACAERLQQRGAIVIAGNHDLIGTGLLGFERCSNKAMHSLKNTRRRLAPGTADWLRALPSHHCLEEHVLLTHGGVRDVQQYMTKPHHVAENAAYLRADFPGRRICLFGHTHEQKVFEVEGDRIAEVPAQGTVRLDPRREYFINPGSVDASRKRGRKLAEYAILDTTACSVRFESTAYDDVSTESRAAAAGYRIDRWRDRLYDVQRRIIGPRHVEG